MRQSKKLWRKAAALVCSFALLMGSSLQAMPTMVISATDGESSTSEDSGSMEDENSNAAEDSSFDENADSEDSQPETEGLSGQVIDEDGNPVANATVSCGEIEATTGLDGSYTLSGLPKQDSYSITVNRGDGYKEETFDDVSKDNGNITVSTYYTVTMNVEDYKFYYYDQSEGVEKEAKLSFPWKKDEKLYFRVTSDQGVELGFGETVSDTNGITYTDTVEFKGTDKKYYELTINGDVGIGITNDATESKFYITDDYEQSKVIDCEGIPASAINLYYANYAHFEGTPAKSEDLQATVNKYKDQAEYAGVVGIIDKADFENNGLKVTENGTYYFCFEDAEGNLSELTSCIVDKVDATAPTVAIDSIVVVNDGESTKSTIKATVTDSTDKNGDNGNVIGEVYLSSDKNGEKKIADATPNGDTYEISFDGDVISENYYIIASDNTVTNDGKGNETIESVDGFTMKVSYADTRASSQSIHVTVNDPCDVVYQVKGEEKSANLIGDGYTIEADKNETYTIIARKDKNEIARAVVKLSALDDASPTLIISDEYQNENRSWKNSEYEIVGSVNDNDSLDYITVYYTIGDEDETNKKKAKFSSANGEFAIKVPTESGEFDGVYHVWAEDGFNSSDKITCNVRIDKTEPDFKATLTNYVYESDTIGSIINVMSFDLFFKDKITIDVSASDDKGKQHSGISKIEYQLVEASDEAAFENAAFDENSWKLADGYEAGDTETKISIDIPASDYTSGFSGKILVKVTDQAGNYKYAVCDCDTEKETENAHFVVLDKAYPEKPTLDTGGYNSEWTNKNVTIKLSGGETVSGINRYEYKIDDGDWIPMKNDSENSAVTKNNLTSTKDTNATYYFRAVSNTGVEGKAASILVTVQKTKPKNVEVSYPSPNGKNDWYTSIPTVTIPAAKKLSENSAPVKTYYSFWNTQTGETEPIDGTKLTETQYPVIFGDGKYQLKVWTKDEAGNICEDTWQEEFKVDTTAPELENLYLTTADVDGAVGILAQDQNSLVYRYIYQNAVNIQISFNCDISGQSKIEYQFTSSFAYDNAKWNEYNAKTGLTVNPNKKFILAVHATDQAGNQTIVYSDGIIVDNEAPVGEGLAPEITITPDSPNANGYHNGDVGVAIFVQDPPYEDAAYNANGIYSGLSSVLYRVITDGVVTQEETLFHAGEDPTDADLQSSFSTNIVVSSALNNSNNVIVEVVAVDRAGNERITQTGEGTIQIDTTAPTIRISYDNNSPDSSNITYFKEARTATIEVTERNFNPDDVRLTLTNTDGTIPTISGWSVSGGSGNGDDTVYTATLTYSADGDYTFDIAYTDLADNPCTEINYVSGTAAPQEFTIDRTVPVINVSYDNNSASNSKYFSKARVATVVINEHNFDSSRVKIIATASKEGKSITIPSSNISWSGSGDNHTATINYKEDGDYTFDIQFTDMAGNESEDANYGSSVAGKDFVVDTTIEKPTVTLNDKDGNGKAFKDDLKLAISFGDINYDSYEVKLLRTRKGIKNEDVTSKFIKNLTVNGSFGEGTFDTFQKMQENDGIYTLTVTINDKAGNAKTTEVKFTINRFGSVYEYSDYLTELITDGGAYVQALDDDLAITEYNADRLVKDSLEIVITKDGKPLENVDCEVTPVINDQVSTGSSGWYQYDYTISKDNFAEDGVYKMVVSSKDEAGNTPENANYEDQSILFHVDSTAPELTSVTGLEKAVINAQAVSVGYDVYDTIGLKSVTIYVDGAEVDQITDFTADANNYDGTFNMNESKKAQSVRLVVEDRAGNITDTDAEGFTSAYPFERAVTISTNLFVRWYANQPLFWGSIGGVAVVGVGIGFLIFFLKKRKKSEPVGNVK